MSAQLNTEKVNEYLTQLRNEEGSAHPFLLHFDPMVETLDVWPWPVSDAGERITPFELVLYRAPGFRRPCCLCAVPKLDGSGPGYTESVVSMVVNGDRFGEYAVACAAARCGYQVYLEAVYGTLGLPLKRYRDPERRPVKLQGHARSKASSIPAGMRTHTPSAFESSYVRLMRLDKRGLPQADFRHLFIRCHECRWVMTRSASKGHACPRADPQEIIDLTLGVSSDTE